MAWIETTTVIEKPEDEEEDPLAAQMGLEEFDANGKVVVDAENGLPVRLDGVLKMRLNPGGQGEMKQSFTRKVERVTE